LTIAPRTSTPAWSQKVLLRKISSVGWPTPPEATRTTFAPRSLAMKALESPKAAPAAALPVPSITIRSRLADTRAKLAWIFFTTASRPSAEIHCVGKPS
jgi:hypothetical protein